MTTHTNPPLWTGAFVRICLVNLFIFVNVHALLPTFPFYVASQGGGAVAIGIATALFSLASIAARPFVGHVADARGRRPLLVAGTLGLVLLSAGYAVAGALTLALVMRTAHGACHAAASNASNTWVTDLLPRRRPPTPRLLPALHGLRLGRPPLLPRAHRQRAHRCPRRAARAGAAAGLRQGTRRAGEARRVPEGGITCAGAGRQAPHQKSSQ